MSQWPQFQYTYDGSFAGFLCCVYESYVRRELPVCFAMAEDPRLTLWPDRAVETCREHAERVYRSLARRICLETSAGWSAAFSPACRRRNGGFTTLSGWATAWARRRYGT